MPLINRRRSRHFSSLFQRHSLGKRKRRRLKVETLESRCVLAAAGILTPSVTGTVFLDGDDNELPSTGEGLADVLVELYEDDGDGVLNINVDTMVADDVSDGEGVYCFEDLDPDASYFVFQPPQTVNGTSVEEKLSDELRPGLPRLMIDGFETMQNASATPPSPSMGDSVLSFPDESEVLGQERDILANLISGNGVVNVSINPFGDRPTLQYNSQVAVTGSATVVWDGIDNDAMTINPGLDSIDLTQAGLLNGITFRIGAAAPGAEARLRLYNGDPTNFSEATINIPVTLGGAADSYEFIPFTSFTGPVDETDVDAISLMLDASSSEANNIELALFGVNGPVVENFLNVAQTDLSITKTNMEPVVVPGQAVQYTVEVTNNGPSDVFAATIVDNLPNELTSVTFTSDVFGNATGNTPSGQGNINDVVFMGVDSVIVYTVSGVVSSGVVGSISNTATVSVPAGMVDTDPSNNTATDSDPLQREVDLTISKTNGLTSIVPGQPVTYTIVVTNTGPSRVDGARVVDDFPLELTDVTYQSLASGNVSGNSDGVGDIDDIVDMSPGSSITYTVDATVLPNVTGTLSNTANVSAPEGTTELDPTDNTATDADSVTPVADLRITKINEVVNVNPEDVLAYEIEVRNGGPSTAFGATVSDIFPTSLTNVSYISSGSAGVIGNTEVGTGDINDEVTLPVGSSLTYIVTATVASDAIGEVRNTAGVDPPAGTIDPSTNNNTATDVDGITPVVDLSITKSNGVSNVNPTDVLTYVIEVRNEGPSTAFDATVSDLFPSTLEDVTYVSSGSAGVIGNTEVGTGDIIDQVTLPAGSLLTYTVTATVVSGAIESVQNTATVVPPEGTIDASPDNDSATDVDSISSVIDLNITKTDGVSTVNPEDVLTYVIEVRNEGPSTATGATITDNFSSALTEISYVSFGTAGVIGNTEVGTGDIVDQVTLPAGSSLTYTVTATVAAGATGTLQNTATVDPPEGATDASPDDDSATDMDEIVPLVDLSITKSDDISTVTPNDEITYVIEVVNDGPSAAVGANVADMFPDELADVSYVSTGSAGVIGNTEVGTGDIIDEVTLPAGSLLTYTVTATVAADATGSVANTATVEPPDGTIDSSPGNNSATDVDTVTPVVDLSITKTDGVSAVLPSDVLTYVIDVRNDGPSAAVGAVVRDIFPSSLTNISYVSSGSSGVTGHTEAGSGDIDDQVTLPAGSTLTYTVTATVVANAIGVVENTATVDPPDGTIDSSTGNDAATDIDSVTPIYDLSITKTAGNSTLVAGEGITYTIEVRNSGPSGLVGATITDVFPLELNDVTYTSTSTGGATGNTPNGTGDIDDLLDLPAASTVIYLARGTVPADATGTITNTASIVSGPFDTNPENDSATDVSRVVRRADLSITKTDNLDEVSPGDPLTYSIVVRNDGPSDVAGATIVDNFPSELIDVRYTSEASGNAVGNTDGFGNINDVVTLPAGSSIRYTVDATVDGSARGEITNTATVDVPSDVTETDPADNSGTDTTDIEVVLRSISGFVYVDDDNDGVREAGERPIVGVAISLSGEDNFGNAISRETSTTSDGRYEFEDLPLGLYTFRQTQPLGFPDGRETLGLGAAIEPTVADDVFEGLGLGRDSDAEGFNFAELRPTRSKRDYLSSSFGDLS